MSKRKCKHGAAYNKGYEFDPDLRRTYFAWRNMKARCKYKAHPNAEHYGARGITYADEWESFEPFLAAMGICPQGYSLDRADVDGNYSPQNCRWATVAEQARNKRRTVLLTKDGVTKCMEDWAADLGVHASTLIKRLRKWPLDRVLEPKHG